MQDKLPLPILYDYQVTVMKELVFVSSSYERAI